VKVSFPTALATFPRLDERSERACFGFAADEVVFVLLDGRTVGTTLSAALTHRMGAELSFEAVLAIIRAIVLPRRPVAKATHRVVAIKILWPIVLIELFAPRAVASDVCRPFAHCWPRVK
jgi:hypothetical protein